MKTFCIAGSLTAVGILAYAVALYYNTLQAHRVNSYEKKLFAHWSYALCLLLMCIILFAYMGKMFTYLGKPSFSPADLLTGGILLLGAVFMLMVVVVQRHMTSALSQKTEETIRTLIRAVEAKDEYTRGHSEHVANLTNLLYKKLPDHLRRTVNYKHLMDAAVLHDVGKIGVADSVLKKNGALDDDEWDEIRRHPLMGKRIIEQTCFAEVGDIILMHHERIDGKGYYGIANGDIPFESKIIAVADAFSALYSDRVYRPRMSFDDAMGILRAESGTHFDSRLVTIFTAISKPEIDCATQDMFAAQSAPESAVQGVAAYTAF